MKLNWISCRDIYIAHHMEKGNLRPRPIVVRFTNYYSRDRLYRNRTKLHKVNVGRFIEGADRVYINKNLTALRSELFKEVRDKNVHRNWRIWTLDSTGFVKMDPTSSFAIPIRSELHASPHIHIWIGYIWIRQYGKMLHMWASMKFLPPIKAIEADLAKLN